MKHSTLFSFILFVAISICFFSSTVLAGEGPDNDKGDTHPWDMDVIVIDTSDSYTNSLLVVQDPNPFSLPVYSLSYRFTMWLFYDESVFSQEKKVEVIKTEIDYRGTYRSSKLMR